MNLVGCGTQTGEVETTFVGVAWDVEPIPVGVEPKPVNVDQSLCVGGVHVCICTWYVCVWMLCCWRVPVIVGPQLGVVEQTSVGLGPTLGSSTKVVGVGVLRVSAHCSKQ